MYSVKETYKYRRTAIVGKLVLVDLLVDDICDKGKLTVVIWLFAINLLNVIWSGSMEPALQTSNGLTPTYLS